MSEFRRVWIDASYADTQMGYARTRHTVWVPPGKLNGRLLALPQEPRP
jgi:hypothetical protein